MKLNSAPRTYLGLTLIIQNLRKKSGWLNLLNCSFIELLVAMSYLRIQTSNDLKRYESNEYFRKAINIKSLNILGFDHWINCSDSLLSFIELCEFWLKEDTCINNYKNNLFSIHINGFNIIACGDSYNHPPLRFFIKSDATDIDYVNFDLCKFDISEWLKWFQWDQRPVTPNNKTWLFIDVLITNCILEIGLTSVLPEFRLGYRRYLTDYDCDLLETNGYLIRENFVCDSDVHFLKSIVNDLSKIETLKGISFNYGNDNKLQRVYNLIDKSPFFHSLFLNRPEIYEILQHFFDQGTPHTPYYLSSFQANILKQGALQQNLHVDSSVPDPLPSWKIRLNINLLLDPFTNSNGATLVYPKSHTFLRKPKPTENVSNNMVKVLAPSGSIVIWTGHLWHQSGTNNDTLSRCALLACFVASYLREIAVEENYLFTIDKDRLDTLPHELKVVLGYFHGSKY